MTQQDEQALRDLYAAFSAQDVAAMQQLFDPDVVWHLPGRSVLAGDHRGVDAVLAFFGRVAELSEGTFTVELHDVVASDEHVVSLHTGRGTARGRNLEDHNVIVAHLRGGRIAAVYEHHEDLYAVDAFWGT